MDEREQSLYTHLCKSSLPRGEMDLAIADMKSARAWTDLAGWIRALAAVATTFPNDLKNKNSREGKSRLRIFNGGGNVRTLRVVHEQCADTRVYNVSLPTFRVNARHLPPSEADIV